jgi:hypothetical protein
VCFVTNDTVGGVRIHFVSGMSWMSSRVLSIFFEKPKVL